MSIFCNGIVHGLERVLQQHLGTPDGFYEYHVETCRGMDLRRVCTIIIIVLDLKSTDPRHCAHQGI